MNIGKGEQLKRKISGRSVIILLIILFLTMAIAYEEKFKNREGNDEVFNTTSDDKYVGEFKNGLRHGKGTLNFSDGRKYVGEFKDGTIHGQGTLTDLVNLFKYVGEWEAGEMHGQGTLLWANGRKYIGELERGKMHGQGTLTSSNGRVQSGLWRDGDFLGRK